MSKSLITGINGFVASHLADYLISQGEEVVGTYRKGGDLKKIEHIKNKVSFVSMDLNSYESCLNAFKRTKPDYVHHLAAQAHVPACEKNPREAFETNVLGTVHILEAIRVLMEEDKSYNPSIHVCSSGEVYGAVRKENLPITEDTKLNPSNIYGATKVGAEFAALRYYSSFGLRTIITRTFSHTGPRRTQLSADVNFARQIALIENGKQEPLISHGNLDSLRTWMDVRDAARYYYHLVRKGKPGEIYNVAGETRKTIEEMLDFFISLSPAKNEIRKVQNPELSRKNDIPFQEVSVKKFQESVDIQPKYSFEQTMGDLLNWWRAEVGQ